MLSTIATKLAELGYYVFQLAQNGKKPFANTAPHGCNDASNDVEEVADWYDIYPNQNVGIKCENILVVDVDVKEGDGIADLREIESDLGTLNAPCVKTASGGLHFYFNRPTVKIKGQTHVKYKGRRTNIDIRVGNQYVVAPGSIIDDVVYSGDLPPVGELPNVPQSWIDGFLPLVGKQQDAPAPMPMPIVGLVGTAERCARYVDSLDPAISGQGGHNQFLWAARCIFWGFGLDEPTGRKILEAYNSRCQPPFNPNEIDHKVKSALSGEGFDKPYGWLLASDRSQSTTNFTTTAPTRTPSISAPTVAANPHQPADAPAEPVGSLISKTLDDAYSVEIQYPDWLIFPFLREAECALISAQRGVGKTWFGLTLSKGLTSGEGLFGMPFWYCPKPVKVLYIDGEMAWPDMRERLRSLGAGGQNFRIINPELSNLERGIDLYNDVDQALILNEAVSTGVKVIIVDNLATLYHCQKPNDSESWRQYDKFIIDCRKHGIAILFIDHNGKNNESGAAGSYAKQNIVNHCIQLDRVEADEDEGTRFWVNFSKSRSCYGTAIQSFLLSVTDGKVRHVFPGAKAVKPASEALQDGTKSDIIESASEPEPEPEEIKEQRFGVDTCVEMLRAGKSDEEVLEYIDSKGHDRKMLKRAHDKIKRESKKARGKQSK